MTKPKIRWQELEKIVRAIAESKFGATARAEDIGGVRCDCVIHLGDGSVVIIEISREYALDKLRTDIAKFNVIRPYFFQKNMFPKCYFITSRDPTPALIESGRVNFVSVYSVSQFLNVMLGVQDYVHLRSQKPFGSAVDLYSGEPDHNKYVRVDYFADNGELYGAERIALELIKGRAIILIGDYGSGKSRCVQEVFSLLARDQPQSFRNPIAINLRENWGLKRAPEIITRHFTELGMGEHVADVLKVA